MTARELPAWAAALEPLGMDDAARVLAISRRALTDLIAVAPHYEIRGRGKRVFYPEHIAQLREALKCRSGSSGATVAPMSPAPSPVNAYDKALALATRPKRKSCAPPSRQGSSRVVSMVRPRS